MRLTPGLLVCDAEETCSPFSAEHFDSACWPCQNTALLAFSKFCPKQNMVVYLAEITRIYGQFRKILK